MNLITIVGIAASVFTATSLIPQLVKLMRKKEGGDLSMGMLVVLFVGLALWTWYGFMKEDWIIMISNACSMVVNAAIAFLTIKYKKRPLFQQRF